MPICQDIIKKNGTQCLHVLIQSTIVSNSGKMSVNLSGADHSQMPKCQKKIYPHLKRNLSVTVSEILNRWMKNVFTCHSKQSTCLEFG